MKTVLLLIGLLAGIGGALMTPNGFIGPALMICGAIFFTGAIVGSEIEEVATQIRKDAQTVRDGLRQLVQGERGSPPNITPPAAAPNTPSPPPS